MMKNIIEGLKTKKVFICLACVLITIFNMCLTTSALDYEVHNIDDNAILYVPKNETSENKEYKQISTETKKREIPTGDTSGPEKTNEEIALEVWEGLWGNGQKRKDKLIEAGYDYLTIQPIVNKLVNGELSYTDIINEKNINEKEKNDSLTEEFIVFKESTHYIHTNKCHWYINDKDSCIVIEDTNNISAILCEECNPDIEIVNEYVPEITSEYEADYDYESENEEYYNNIEWAIDDYSRTLLAEIVNHEAGAYWVSQYDKAKVAAGVMNRVYDSRFPNTVYDVLVQSGQFSGYTPGCVAPTQDDYNAVDYYFSHTNEFNSDNSWWGDGYQNHFYYQ